MDEYWFDNFSPGELSKFDPGYIGECKDFKMDNVNPARFQMTITHSGSDGGQFDWARINTESDQRGAQNTFLCFFHNYLDDDSSETSGECVADVKQNLE